MKWIKASVLRLYVFLCKLAGVEVVHFIHIGKTAGTAIREAFASKSNLSGTMLLTGGRLFIMHGHEFTFSDVKEGERAFFVVRDPVARYVSGFYSRKRMGKPRNYNPWSEGERKAFERFETPEELAIALSSDNEQLRQESEAAMKSIGHVRSSYWDWFGNPDYLNREIGKVMFVLHQEELNDCYLKFRKKFSINSGDLPEDEVSSHRNPNRQNKNLTQAAISNLVRWYARDYEFLRMLKEAGCLEFTYTEALDNQALRA